jgi:hypothetical protein
MLGRQRLRIRNVNHSGREVPVVELRDQRAGIEMSTPSLMDEARVFRQCREQVAVQNASCLVRERQQAGEDFRPGQEVTQAARAGKRRDAQNVVRASAPAGEREAEGLEWL